MMSRPDARVRVLWRVAEPRLVRRVRVTRRSQQRQYTIPQRLLAHNLSPPAPKAIRARFGCIIWL
jgi:hypothetical protein